MLLFFLSLEPGSDTYAYQDPLYRSESCRRRLRKTAPCGSPGMATQDRQACRRRYWCFSISCRSTWQLSSVPTVPRLPCRARSAVPVILYRNPGRFGPVSFRPGSFRPVSFRPNLGVGRVGLGRWVVSAWVVSA